jgi:tripartite ATP-independent transporter DctM subunit
MFGFPVAFSLAGTALIFAFGGIYFGVFEEIMLRALPNRLFGIINNETLIAVPLFIFMGSMLEKAKVAEQMLSSMTNLFGSVRGGLAFSVILVGMLLAASTGIVGATVVTMGLLSLPVMLKHGYDKSLSTGIICASGTLGQIIPPSIVLVLLGDVLSSAYQQAQSANGIYPPKAISVGDLFMGALLPGLVLVALYIIYVAIRIKVNPDLAPLPPPEERQTRVTLGELISSLAAPLILIVAVLGSIIVGLASPSEAASVGAVGAIIIALVQRQLTIARLKEVMRSTTKTTTMVFMILIGASIFSLVFRGYDGDQVIIDLFEQLPGGVIGAMIIVMLVMFVLGFILDFIEIVYVVVPIVAPVLLMMGLDPIWLGVMIAINLQTSFLTPPFGFSLFYLRGVAPAIVSTPAIYRGVIPFIALQLLLLVILAFYPDITTWLPNLIYN